MGSLVSLGFSEVSATLKVLASYGVLQTHFYRMSEEIDEINVKRVADAFKVGQYLPTINVQEYNEWFVAHRPTDEKRLVKMAHCNLEKTLCVLSRHGVQPHHFRRVRQDARYAEVIARTILWGTLAVPQNQLRARSLMRDRFSGVEEWGRLWRHYVPKYLLEKTYEIPWGAHLSEPCPFRPKQRVCQTHRAFLGMKKTVVRQPFNIREWDLLANKVGCRRFENINSSRNVHTIDHYDDVLAQDRWYLMSSVFEAWGKTEEEQYDLLPPGYALPNTAEVLAYLAFMPLDELKRGFDGRTEWLIRTRDVWGRAYERNPWSTVVVGCRYPGWRDPSIFLTGAKPGERTHSWSCAGGWGPNYEVPIGILASYVGPDRQ